MGAEMVRSRISVCLLLVIFAGILSHISWPAIQKLNLLEIEGIVSDAAGPVAGARVRFQAEETSTLSDAAGRFHLHANPAGSRRIVASKSGYFIAGSEVAPLRTAIRLRPLPEEDNQDYEWVDPTPSPISLGNCGNCHAEIHREWSGSGHAKSVSNRRFLNLYEGTDWHGKPNVGWNLLRENPDGSGVCTACHAPSLKPSEPAYFDLRLAGGTAARGVHCDYCHKIADASNDQIGLTHGKFGLKLLRPREGQLFFGPLDDVDRGEEVFSPLYHQSLYCAACHEGTVFGVHAYSTYSEWLASPAKQEGKQCQNCHMQPTGWMTNVAPGKGGIERNPQTLASHGMFTRTKEEMLRHCLEIRVRVRPNQDRYIAEVEILARDVGHRVPTGFPDRNLLLALDGISKDGRDVPPISSSFVLSGVAGHEYKGHAGKLFAKQVLDFDGRAPVPFWRARPETIDTRLRPGIPERIDVTWSELPAKIRVRVLHRDFWPEVATAKGWKDNEIVVIDHTLEIAELGVTVWASK